MVKRIEMLKHHSGINNESYQKGSYFIVEDELAKKLVAKNKARLDDKWKPSTVVHKDSASFKPKLIKKLKKSQKETKE